MGWDLYWVYLGVVGGGGSLVVWYLHRAIRRAETQRSERLERIKRFEAIRTSSPVVDHTTEARERGLESIATRFALMRRLLVPLACIGLTVMLGLPLLSGVPAAVVSLLVAVVAVIAGIAAKPLLENLIAGVVISYSQPIRIGDTVLIDGFYGTIEDITLTHTTIKVWDWRRYMVPNHRMIEKEFVNYSIIDRYQWAYVEFWVAPHTDLEQVEQIAVAAASHSRYFSAYEEPRFWVMELGKEGVRCWVAAWANTPSAAWQLMHEIRTTLAREFRAAGIQTHLFVHRGLESAAPATFAAGEAALPGGTTSWAPPVPTPAAGPSEGDVCTTTPVGYTGPGV